jgi:hypothetical protein
MPSDSLHARMGAFRNGVVERDSSKAVHSTLQLAINARAVCPNIVDETSQVPILAHEGPGHPMVVCSRARMPLFQSLPSNPWHVKATK